MIQSLGMRVVSLGTSIEESVRKTREILIRRALGADGSSVVGPTSCATVGHDRHSFGR